MKQATDNWGQCPECKGLGKVHPSHNEPRGNISLLACENCGKVVRIRGRWSQPDATPGKGFRCSHCAQPDQVFPTGAEGREAARAMLREDAEFLRLRQKP